LPGSVKGRMSENEFYYTDLMYNRKNWRDLSKDKTISRQEEMLKANKIYYLIQLSMHI
jgi:hypothetical protein